MTRLRTGFLLLSLWRVLVAEPALAQSCPFCAQCTASGRSVVTLTGTTTSRVTRTNDNSVTVDATGWLSNAVTWPAIGSPGPTEAEALRLSGSDLCVLGPTINGHLSPLLTWSGAHDTVGGAGVRVTVSTGQATLLEGRIHNVEDAFKTRETPIYDNLGTMNVSGAYLTFIRDDAVENDNFMPVQVVDSLFDGVHNFYSEQEQSTVTSPTTIGPEEDTTANFTNVLVRLDRINAPEPNDAHTVGYWFKLQPRGARGHVVHVTDSTFATSVVSRNAAGNVDWDKLIPPATTTWHGTNTILWLGSGTYGGPKEADLTLAPGARVIFLEGAAAQARWSELRRGWLERHGYLPATVNAVSSSGKVDVSWSAAPRASSFSVMRSVMRGGAATRVASNLSATTFADTTVQAGVTYFYRVVATDACGATASTVEVIAPPMGTPAVAAPKFYPRGQSFSGRLSISLNTTTPGAAIRTTLDGSLPTATHGELYNGPFTIDSTTTVQAIAYDSLTSSSIVSEHYVLISGSDGGGVTDAGAEDAGLRDAGPPDAGAPDAGATTVPPADAGEAADGGADPDRATAVGCGTTTASGHCFALLLLLLAKRRATTAPSARAS